MRTESRELFDTFIIACDKLDTGGVECYYLGNDLVARWYTTAGYGFINMR